VRSSIIVHKPGLVSKLESGARDAIEREGYQRTVGIAQFSPDERPAILALYDGCVRMLDDEIAGYLAVLEELKLLDETLIVLTSDHGEQLLERGAVGHSSCSLEGNLYDENIRIPLILRAPGRLPQGCVVGRQVSQVDIMPTIFEVLGVPMPGPVAGRSLVPLAHDPGGDWLEEAYAETSPCGWQSLADDRRLIHCIRRPPWKLIRYHAPGAGERFELVNLSDDPGECRDVYAGHPEIAGPLREKLAAWIATRTA
jgi:arylsulfatase A-like enzyme